MRRRQRSSKSGLGIRARTLSTPAAVVAGVSLLAACGTNSGSSVVAYPNNGGLILCSAVTGTDDVRTNSVAVIAVEGDQPVSLVAWRATTTDGLEVTGASVAPYAQTSGGGGLKGYPPDDLVQQGITVTPLDRPVTIQPSGTKLDPSNPPTDDAVVVLVGSHLAAGRQDGTLRGVEVDYKDGSGTRRTVTIDTQLTLTRGQCGL